MREVAATQVWRGNGNGGEGRVGDGTQEGVSKAGRGFRGGNGRHTTWKEGLRGMRVCKCGM